MIVENKITSFPMQQTGANPVDSLVKESDSNFEKTYGLQDNTESDDSESELEEGDQARLSLVSDQAPVVKKQLGEFGLAGPFSGGETTDIAEEPTVKNTQAPLLKGGDVSLGGALPGQGTGLENGIPEGSQVYETFLRVVGEKSANQPLPSAPEIQDQHLNPLAQARDLAPPIPPEKPSHGVKNDPNAGAQGADDIQVKPDTTISSTLDASLMQLKGRTEMVFGESIPFGDLIGGTLTSSVSANPAARGGFAELATVPPRTVTMIAEAASALGDRPVELTLNPEELGRVRLTMRSHESGMAVVITVERPETLDLFRRNIGQLATQLHDLGYQDLSFDFAGQGQEFTQDGGSEFTENSADTLVPIPETATPDTLRLNVESDGGVDIRL